MNQSLLWILSFLCWPIFAFRLYYDDKPPFQRTQVRPIIEDSSPHLFCVLAENYFAGYGELTRMASLTGVWCGPASDWKLRTFDILFSGKPVTIACGGSGCPEASGSSLYDDAVVQRQLGFYERWSDFFITKCFCTNDQPQLEAQDRPILSAPNEVYPLTIEFEYRGAQVTVGAPTALDEITNGSTIWTDQLEKTQHRPGYQPGLGRDNGANTLFFTGADHNKPNCVSEKLPQWAIDSIVQQGFRGNLDSAEDFCIHRYFLRRENRYEPTPMGGICLAEGGRNYLRFPYTTRSPLFTAETNPDNSLGQDYLIAMEFLCQIYCRCPGSDKLAGDPDYDNPDITTADARDKLDQVKPIVKQAVIAKARWFNGFGVLSSLEKAFEEARWGKEGVHPYSCNYAGAPCVRVSACGGPDSNCRCVAAKQTEDRSDYTFYAFCTTGILLPLATAGLAAAEVLSGQRGLLRPMRERLIGRGLKSYEEAPCPCNATYVSHGCCEAFDGIVWEKPHLKLGELRV